MPERKIVEQATILRATVGSTVHGLHHEGQDDRDEMAVYIEPPEYVIGLKRAARIKRGLYGFEHYVERTQPEGVRSGPGDLDLVAYSLRKYIRLALQGHPTILLLLFVPDELVLVRTPLGEELRALLPALLSRRAGRGYLGYLHGQRERLLETRAGKRVNRPELLDAHGFDTKYAMHAARLGGASPRRSSGRRCRRSPTGPPSTSSSSGPTGARGAGSPAHAFVAQRKSTGVRARAQRFEQFGPPAALAADNDQRERITM